MARGRSGHAGPVGETIEGYIRPNRMEVRKIQDADRRDRLSARVAAQRHGHAAALCLKARQCGHIARRVRGDKLRPRDCPAYQRRRFARRRAGGGGPIIETTDRAAARELMSMKAYIDCLIPRGGKGLIRTVIENSTIPVMEHGDGNCHVYVDGKADLDMAGDIVFNAKVQNPSVCNAAETLLVSEQIAADFFQNM